MNLIRSIVAASGLAVAPLAPAQDQPLPITNLTLYRSGVGYFERRAQIEGDRKIQLRFATDQINDILKSMVLLDLDGGRIDAVSYGSKEPLQRRLASFGVDLSDEPPLGTILARLRGAGVKFVLVDGTNITGAILGGEMRPQALGNAQQPVPIPFVNVVTNSGIRYVNLTQITSVELTDKDLNAELTKALAAIAEHHADRIKTVDVSLKGGGSRRVVVAYVHEMPVWKTSYRLVLPEPATGNPGNAADRPTIQGWAIVENTTDEDWHDVRLSLVAGRPVSFQMDLYEPLHVERPLLPVPTIPGVVSRAYEGGIALDDMRRADEAPPAPMEPADKAIARRAPGAPRASSIAAGRGAAALRDAEYSAGEFAGYAAQAQAQGGEIGEVFQYTLKDPVTIERQRSAMLPILAAPIDGRRVSIYSRADGSEHPMRGVEIINTTGLQLMPGPISVFDGSAYAGDAQIGHVTLGDKRLLAYAVDLDVTATARDESVSTVQRIRIVQGLIEQTTKLQSKVTYGFSNKDAKRGRTVLIEHPRVDGWTLVEPAKPADETPTLYRFEAAVDPGKAASVAVVQERVERQSIAVASYDLPTLLAYTREGKVSQKVVDAVREAARLQAAVGDTQQAVARLDQERQGIEQDQARIRQNMQSIARDTELYRRYTTKLNEQETRLEQIGTEREKALAAVRQAQAALDAYVRGLNIE
jgi:hypothetical protein